MANLYILILLLLHYAYNHNIAETIVLTRKSITTCSELKFSNCLFALLQLYMWHWHIKCCFGVAPLQLYEHVKLLCKLMIWYSMNQGLVMKISVIFLQGRKTKIRKRNCIFNISISINSFSVSAVLMESLLDYMRPLIFPIQQ